MDARTLAESGRGPAPRRRAAAGAAALGVAIAVYAYAASRPHYPPDTGLRVDPFSVQSAEPAVSDLRDAIQDMIAARLMTAELGAGQLLQGEVGGTPERLSIDAALIAIPSGVVRARARVQGNADSLPYFTDRLAARLLAVQAARDSEELAALTATSLPALRAYLAGRQAYRRGRVGAASEAGAHFERALFLDSTFALAGLRLAEIAVRFGMAERDERWKIDAIWQLRDRLGPADRALLEAYLGPRYPQSATLAELIAAGERATLVAPQRLEAWHIAGVSFFRFGPRIGYPGWEARAAEAFQRAFALDSTEILPLQYLLLLAAVQGDRVAVGRYAARDRSYPVGGQQSEFIQWVAAAVLGDSAALARLRRRIPEMSGVSLQSIVEWSENLGLGLEDADRAARAYDQHSTSVGQRRSVVVRLVPFLLNRGRPGAASRLLATAERGFGQAGDVGVLEFRIYAALYWDGDSSEAAAAARSLEAYLGGAPVPPGQARDRQTAACALAHWRLGTGDLAAAEAALGQLRAPYLVESTPVCVAAAAAQLAAARRRPDAAAALARLDRLLAAGSDVQQLFPTVATVIAVRLYEARGDRQHALALARRRTFWWNWLLSTPLREEGRLAALVGDTAGAIRAYQHYLALRSDPEPRLRPGVDRVRTELARLERFNPAP
ncbi:MAG TPA: hypothetical protein VGV13_00995 [Methylomirabilota bacterium]|jgi:hypothetical protein|nr:hypothetical protein [Methylomirabilota bacterium]